MAMASSASLSLSNMSSATIYQYKGSSATSVDGWKIGYALSSPNWNLCIKFTPSKTLSKVVFKLTADSVSALDSKGFFYLLRTTSGHPGVDTIDGGTKFTFSSKKATITLTRTGNFVAGTPYYLWLSATSGTYNSVAILYSSGISCTTTVASFTVTFNPNGGTTTKTSQAGTSVTLPTAAECTRTGYQLAGWSTSSTATSASYSPGASYTPSATITLYAVWTPNTYQVTYNANGGTGAPSAQTKTHDISLTLSSTIPIRSGYTFQGWAISADGEVVYASGASYTANSAITLYAVWKADVSPVYIKDSSGNFNAYYTYIANSNGEFELYSAYIYTNNEWKECIM